MAEIDLPGLKERLWHTMRDDLVSLVPAFADNNLLLCPTCCRALKYEEFSLEHIIPQQALAEDPVLARAAVPKNERSGMTLLCSCSLVFRNKSIPGHGCNSWKGSHYDRFIREALQPDFSEKTVPFSTSHGASGGRIPRSVSKAWIPDRPTSIWPHNEEAILQPELFHQRVPYKIPDGPHRGSSCRL